MTEARHEATVSVRPEAPSTRPVPETDAAKRKQAKSGVHPTDALQRDAFTRDVLRRMAESTKPAPELAPPAAGGHDAPLAHARRELLRMAGEDLPVSAPSAFDEQEVTTRRAHPLLLAQSSRGSAPDGELERDEDTVVQDVSELLAAADAQLDALTTEIRSVITTLPPPPSAPVSAHSPRVEPEPAHVDAPSQASAAAVSVPALADVLEPVAAERAEESARHEDDSVPVMLVVPPRRASTPAPLEPAELAPRVALSAPPAARSWKGKVAVLAALVAVAGLGVMRFANQPAHTAPAARPAAQSAQAPAPMAALPAEPAPAPASAPQVPVHAAPEPAPSLLAALHESDSAPAAPTGDVPSLVSRGLASLRAGQPRAARELLGAAAARTSINPHVYAGICEADLMLGFPQRALSAAQSALKLRPRRARYHQLIARVYDALGQTEDAAEARRQADIVAPYDPDQPARAPEKLRADAPAEATEEAPAQRARRATRYR